MWYQVENSVYWNIFISNTDCFLSFFARQWIDPAMTWHYFLCDIKSRTPFIGTDVSAIHFSLISSSSDSEMIQLWPDMFLWTLWTEGKARQPSVCAHCVQGKCWCGRQHNKETNKHNADSNFALDYILLTIISCWPIFLVDHYFLLTIISC
jgi:hypothetical protein